MTTSEVNPFVHLSAGAIGGTIGVIVTSPLELLKTRQQSSISSYKTQKIPSAGVARLRATNPISLWGEIVKREGPRSLYKGLTPSLAAVVPSKALFFMVNAECRRFLRRNCTHQGHVVHLAAGTMAGAVNAFVMNPFWVVKTKLQLDERTCSKTNITRTIGELYRTEKFRAFFRGSSASVVGSFEHGIYFLIYEEMKSMKLGYNWFSEVYRDTSLVPITFHLSVSACISKMISNTIIYPTEVLRTRLREDSETPYDKRKYRKFWKSFKTVYQEEGMAGLYGGWTLQLFKTIPFTIITFLVYETCIYQFSDEKQTRLVKY